ncbi:MAG: TIGR03546 family protein [Bdellovibrionota bacterium]
MTIILKQLYGLVKMLNSETGQNQIAAGIALGFILGMTPAFSLQTVIVFLCLFIFRVQIGMAFLAAFFCKFIAWILDPAFDAVGSSILEIDALQGFFTTLYNMPIVPLTRFNNSIVMGSAVITIVLAPFVFFLARAGILKYRATVVARLKETKAWKWMKATSLYDWYCTYDKHFGT